MNKQIWIIGAGHFGAKAYEQLNQKDGFVITLVDPDTASFNQIPPDDHIDNKRITQDGIAWLLKNLDHDNSPDWIIPALPLHMAAEWIFLKSEQQLKRIDVPESVDHQVPNPLRGVRIDLYASHATFQCPDNCPEPEKICTYTKKPRKENMFDILKKVSVKGFTTIVLRSYQLAPGIGGIDPGQLFHALDQVNHSTKNCLICTACRCHGVLSAFKNR